MTPDTHITHGKTYAEVLTCKGMTRRKAAEALGVPLTTFWTAIHRKGIGHIFAPDHRTSTLFMTTANVTMEQAEAQYGKTSVDAAAALGVEVKPFRIACHKHKVHDKFVWQKTHRSPEAKAASRQRRGKVASHNEIDLDDHPVTCNVCGRGFVKSVWPGTKIHKIQICNQCG